MKNRIIGFDGLYFVDQPSGIGKFLIDILRILITNVDAEFKVFSNNPVVLPSDIIDKVTIVVDKPFTKNIKKIVWLKLWAGFLLRNHNLDYYFSGTGFLPSLHNKIKKIVLVHDLNYKLVPETMGKLNYLSHVLFFKRDIKKSDFIVCNSHGTANKVKTAFGRTADQIFLPLVGEHFRSYDTDFIANRLINLNINYPYFLTVGNIEPRKNLLKTIKCFLKLKEEGLINNYKLVMAGGNGWNNGEINSLCNSNKEHIVRLGYVKDEDLPYLYNGATIFLFPSIYEGFGIPVREAIRCGTPVITSNIEELRESAADLATLIDPINDREYIDAILSNVERVDIKLQVTFNDPPINKLLDYLAQTHNQ